MPRPLGSKNHYRKNDLKYPTSVDRQMHRAYLVHRCMAKFRYEEYELTEEEFFNLWRPYWSQRGRKPHNMTMTRDDPEKAWTVTNCIFMNRHDHLVKEAKRQAEARL